MLSEYQYYEFQAIDRPLDADARAALRELSSRADITASSFVNTYEWGDFRGDPKEVLAGYFDLFLYLANWGSRRFAVRLPARLLDIESIGRFCHDECCACWTTGDHAVVDIWRDEIDAGDWVEGGGVLAGLVPLREDILRGDLRLFYLVWLMSVEDGLVEDAVSEPLPGLAPLSPALAAAADFFDIDPDLVEAAAASGAPAGPPDGGRAAATEAIRTLSVAEKDALLLRLYDGERHLGAELRRRMRVDTTGASAAAGGQRTAGELRSAARRLAAERERAAAARAAAERRQREAAAAEARETYLNALAKRGEASWRDVEQLITSRNGRGYESAVSLIADLRELARRTGQEDAVTRRVDDIRARHDRKRRLIERLDAAGLGQPATLLEPDPERGE